MFVQYHACAAQTILHVKCSQGENLDNYGAVKPWLSFSSKWIIQMFKVYVHYLIS